MSGRADSEGMALAYKALCDTIGIECTVVEGRLDRTEHYWNIVTLEGDSYHVDTSRASSGVRGSRSRATRAMASSSRATGPPARKSPQSVR